MSGNLLGKSDPGERDDALTRQPARAARQILDGDGDSTRSASRQKVVESAEAVTDHPPHAPPKQRAPPISREKTRPRGAVVPVVSGGALTLGLCW